jgi:glucan endo-1,3-alpha-glucosidase
LFKKSALTAIVATNAFALIGRGQEFLMPLGAAIKRLADWEARPTVVLRTNFRFAWVATVAALLIGTYAHAGEAPQKLILAHYMACCPKGGLNSSVDQYEDEIRSAISEGIDGFSINIGAFKAEPNYEKVVDRLYLAAKKYPQFHLVFSFDRLSAEESADLIQKFADDSNSLRYNGRVVVSGWGQDPAWVRDIQALMMQRGISIFLIPNMNYPLRSPVLTSLFESGAVRSARLALTTTGVDGVFYFGAGSPYREMVSEIGVISEIARREQKKMMSGISPYYKGFGINSRVFESRGFEGMREMWLAIIAANLDWVQLVTWNDWNEATYLQPFNGPREDIWSQPGWHNLLNHGGFLKASRYYMEWFRSGRAPRISEDRVFYFYRLHPKASRAIVDFNTMEFGRPRFFERLDDRIYLTTFLTEAAELTIRVGDSAQTIIIPAGAHSSSVPMAVGSVNVSMLRGENLFARETLPLPITPDGLKGDFNYLSGELVIKRPQAGAREN